MFTSYIDRWAESQSDQTAFIFLNSDGEESQRISFKELKEKARGIANTLIKNQCREKRVVLFFQPGIEFIVSFLGCLYAGTTAVPIPPPQGKRQSERVKAILADAQVDTILTTKEIKDRIFDIEALWIDFNDAIRGNHADIRLPHINKEDIAFLQYTSGSTSNPKGVMISHGNLIANEKIIAEAFGHSKDSKIAGWLPFYHDMGLIGNILQPLYLGVTCILMSPITFLQNPLIWLQTISKYKITTSGGPNFAYQLCTNRVTEKDLETLDLSNWKVAFNGSEPVYCESIERFAEKFGRCGFNKNAFYPCYGLAEATLFVTGPRVCEPLYVAEQDKRVSCGQTRFNENVCIVDPTTQAILKDHQIGEIWVSGESVAQGYWNMPEQTDYTFHAYTIDGQGPFMRTGDLGFLENSKLYISGRLKNVMILRGKNYFPHDIENFLKESHSDLKMGQFAAISIPHAQEEKLVVVYELDRSAVREKDFEHLIQLIKSGLSQEFQLDPHAVLLVKPGSIPRTTSGKLQHHLCKEKYLAQTFSVVGEWNRSTHGVDENHPFSKILSLSPDQISFERSFAEHGIDSLKAVQLQSYFKSSYGIELTFEQIFGDISIKQLLDQPKNESLKPTVVKKHLNKAPLSPNQLDMWVAHQINPNTIAYHIPVKLSVKGEFNISVFKNAWQELMKRHSILRTVIRTENGIPEQYILDYCEAPIEMIDTSFEACYQQLVNTPFQLDQGPLFRIAIIKTIPNEYVLICNFHHIICDGWSMGILVDELSRLYRGEHLVPLTCQYANYSMHPGTNIEKLTEAWVHYLDLNGEFPQLSISNFHRAPKVRSDEGKSINVAIDDELFQGIKEQCLKWNCTVANLLLSTFHAVLHLYSNEKVIIIGYPSANRKIQEFQKLIGFFVNTQVNKTIHTVNTTFNDLLCQVREGLRFGMQNEGLPFQVLLDTLHVPRVEGVSPLFQAMFVMQNAPKEIKGFPGVEFEFLNNPSYPVLYDLVLEVAENSKGLKLTFEYKKDCLPEVIVKELSQTYLMLLRDVLENPEIPLAKLPWHKKLKMPSSQKVIANPASEATSVVDLIRNQAILHPEKIAIRSEKETLSYSQLINKAEEIASALIEKGIGTEEPIGFCLDRGLLLNPTILGIIMAGGAYVPLDPNYPQDRTQWMLEDAGIRTILTHDYYLDKFSYFEGNLIDPSTLVNVAKNNFPIIQPNQLAYILFTSGSTGRPKGVMIEHRSLLNFTRAGKELFATSEKDCSLQFASISWDTSNEETYPCLASGGTVVLRSNDPVEPFVNLIRMTEEYGITMWNFPTSYWHDLISYLISKKISLPQSLRLLIIGGEKVFKEKVEEWITHFGDRVLLLNTYGATEATSISCASNLCRWNREGPDIPIGTAIGNVSVTILNSAMQPVPMGVSGDLYIGGQGLARGYLNPELNKEKFIGKLYKTGDTAYVNSDGEIFIKGRSDNQIKRRGYRIELEEIQTHINKTPGVEKSLVILKSSELNAYIVGKDISKDIVIQHLKSALPGYMFPDKFIFLPDFPRLPNGKINMQELEILAKKVNIEEFEEDIVYSETESTLIRIWKELLGNIPFKLNDSFFDVGGNSLKIIALHQAINDTFQIQTSIADLFRYHTCGAQASMIDKEMKPKSNLELLQLLAEGSINIETVKSTLNTKR
jgi:amino acid adenylation domain-containing protein